jgi:type VII secretion integral membrane protein EccD
VSAVPATRPTGSLTRVTIIGRRRRVDVVLPSDEPLGLLLPEIVAVVGYEPGELLPEYQLSLLSGQVLEPGTCLRRAGVADGALVRIDPITDAPPPPVVVDVTGDAADELARHRDRWDAAARRWTVTAVVCATMLVASAVVAGEVTAVIRAAIALGVLLVGSAAAVAGAPAVGVAVLAGGTTLALAAVPSWVAGWAERGELWVAAVGAATLATGIAVRQPRVGLIGGCTVLAFDATWVGLSTMDVPASRVASVVAVMSAGVLGVLPRIAVTMSGLNRLAARGNGGQPVDRASAMAAVSSAHRGLALACLATAAAGAISGWVLAGTGQGWATALACLLALTLLLRARSFPLVTAVVALTAASFVTGAGILFRWVRDDPGAWWAAGVAAVAAGALALVLLVVESAPPARAWARRIADHIEGWTVPALVSVAAGVFAAYPRLLGS